MNKSLTCGLDWLQYSVKWTDADATIATARGIPDHPAFRERRDTTERVHPYQTTVGLLFGVLAYSQHEQWRKIFYQFTGSDLGGLLMEGVSSDSILRHAHSCEARFSRIDFAIDLRGYGAKPREMDAEWRAGRIRTRVANAGLYSSSALQSDGSLIVGDTMYVGSAKGRQQLRVYDKGAQTGQGGDWIRIELVTRHEAAQVLADAIVAYGVERAGRTAIARFCSTDLPWYSQAIETDPCEIGAMAIHADDTPGWLMSQVLPALRREVEQEIAQGSYRLYNAFGRALSDAYHAGNRRDL